MAPELYDKLGYFAVRLLAVARVLVEKGVLTESEIHARMAALKGAKAEPEGEASAAATKGDG